MDVTGVAWRTSSYSGNHPDSRQLAFAPATWKTFTKQLKAAAPA
jgi:hypothetical protein